ncbi:Sec-independent protein translocase protein TatB [Sphingomonas sp.]|uniref:Sec-independent protein translocase protein TatB n=1 Tax=Sphingomonas sp. TaxID=28214 RepID=UPI003CC6A286
MFDIAPSEFLLVAIVALVVIGPKDLPKAMRVLGYWVGRARGVARQFRSGFDSMVREAELQEMEKKWASENARILAEHPATPAEAVDIATAELPAPPAEATDPSPPLMVEKPLILPAPHETAPTADAKAAS